MNIVIFRRRFTPWSVDGTLVINGVLNILRNTWLQAVIRLHPYLSDSKRR